MTSNNSLPPVEQIRQEIKSGEPHISLRECKKCEQMEVILSGRELHSVLGPIFDFSRGVSERRDFCRVLLRLSEAFFELSTVAGGDDDEGPSKKTNEEDSKALLFRLQPNISQSNRVTPHKIGTMYSAETEMETFLVTGRKHCGGFARNRQGCKGDDG